MTDRPLKFGLIGAGRWGRIYIRTLAGLDGVNLTRLASSNPQSPALAGADCTMTPDWRAVAEADDLDGVIIATPPHLHAEMTAAAVDAGNPVLVEKPLTLNLAEAQDLLALTEQAGGLVMVDHIHLFHGAYRALKERAHGLGNLQSIRTIGGDWGPFRSDVGVLWDRGSHDISMCLDLVGALPETVTANIKEQRQTEDGPGEMVSVTLTFADGLRAEIEIGNLMEAKQRLFTIQCDGEILTYDDLSPDKTEPPLNVAINEFAQAIRAGSTDLSSLRLGVNVVSVLAQCQAVLVGSTKP